LGKGKMKNDQKKKTTFLAGCTIQISGKWGLDGRGGRLKKVVGLYFYWW